MDRNLLMVLENPHTSALLNVVSGYNQFVRGLASLPEVRALIEQVQSSESLELLFRASELLRAPYDPASESPHDVALAAYLWVLRLTDPEVAHVAAEQVLGAAGLWWARRLAERLLAGLWL